VVEIPVCLWRCMVASGDVAWRSKYLLSSLHMWTIYVGLVFVWTFAHIFEGFMTLRSRYFCLGCLSRGFELRLVVSYEKSQGLAV
jgi:hypothetical protein